LALNTQHFAFMWQEVKSGSLFTRGEKTSDRLSKSHAVLMFDLTIFCY